MRRCVDIHPGYEHLRTFIEQLPERMDTEGTYIYGGRRNLIKMFVAPDGTRLNVKRFRRPSLPNNIVYSLGLRQPKGRRAYTYPDRLLARGIETPQAVAYIEQRGDFGLLQPSYFVSLQCPYRHLLYEVGDAPEGSYEALAQALGRMAAHMHDQGVLHRDFSPGNVLWDIDDAPAAPPAPPRYRFSVVDINRMTFGRVSMADGCRSFARLWGPKRFVQLVATAYAEARGLDPQACVDTTMAARARFWRRYQKKREMEFTLEL